MKILNKIFAKTFYYSKDFSRNETRLNIFGKPKWFTKELEDNVCPAPKDMREVYRVDPANYFKDNDLRDSFWDR